MKTTKNIYLAACFLCTGAILVDVDKTEERHQKFVFDSGPGSSAVERLNNVELEFANKTLMVNAVEYGEAIRQLKSVIHSS